MENASSKYVFYQKIGNYTIDFSQIFNKLLKIYESIIKGVPTNKKDELITTNGEKLEIQFNSYKNSANNKCIIFKYTINEKNYEIYNKSPVIILDENTKFKIQFFCPLNVYDFLDKNKYEYALYLDEKEIDIKSRHLCKNFDKLNKIICQKEKKITISNNKIYEELFNEYHSESFKNNDNKLSFNLSYYLKKNKNNFNYFQQEKRADFIERLKQLIELDLPIYITGISGIGKTISLLYFLKKISIEEIYLTCYFNIKSLSISQEDKIEKEIIPLFRENQKEKYLEFLKLFEQKKDLDLWLKIEFILDYLYEHCSFNQIIIIFDQYKSSLDKNNKLKHFLIKEKYQFIQFIICSSINDSDSKETLFYSKINNNSTFQTIKFNVIYLDELVSIENKLDKNTYLYKLMKKFNFSPMIFDEYVYENGMDNDENKIFKFLIEKYKEVLKYLKVYFSEPNRSIIENYEFIEEIISGKKLTEEEFMVKFNNIPLKFIGYKMDKNEKVYNFTPSFNMFNMALREIYKSTDKDISIKYAKLIKKNNNAQLGNIFDRLVNINFDIKKNIFGEIISHVLIVNEIYRFVSIISLISSNEDNYKFLIEDIFDINKILDKKFIYLEQHNFNGAKFDGGFLKPVEGEDSNVFDLISYQSSISKNEYFSKYILFLIFKQIKQRFKNMLNIEIRNTYFFLYT